MYQDAGRNILFDNIMFVLCAYFLLSQEEKAVTGFHMSYFPHFHDFGNKVKHQLKSSIDVMFNICLFGTQGL